MYFGFLRFSNLKFQKNKLKDHESNYALTILDTIELGALWLFKHLAYRNMKNNINQFLN